MRRVLLGLLLEGASMYNSTNCLLRGARFWAMILLLGMFFPAHASNSVVIPVRVFLYSFTSNPQMDSAFKELHVRGMFDQVNAIWRNFGVRWDVSSVERVTLNSSAFPAVQKNDDRETLRRKLVHASPPDNNGVRSWKVVFIREFPVPGGGVYLPETGTIYFAERTRGGETSPIILAHELGHSLGLPHRTEKGNLMHRAAGARNSSINSTVLTSEQISIAIDQISLGPVTGAQESRNIKEPADAGSVHSLRMPNRSKIAARLRSFDGDGDGLIRLEDVPQPGRNVFRRIDENDDKVIDVGEMNRFLQEND